MGFVWTGMDGQEESLEDTSVSGVAAGIWDLEMYMSKEQRGSWSLFAVLGLTVDGGAACTKESKVGIIPDSICLRIISILVRIIFIVIIVSHFFILIIIPVIFILVRSILICN
jgi:hypothetical protein